ncbi:unnamed protein product [Symbiodinium necroappetens]|uniref:Methyltransferase FkbM domain-containing protein n=1 Tax=Symbiodinium necroappetens TaxID=1628268 RepID=A0A812KM04_9DINO|nr:unnamed protein product [Symbiodinium necroappetens]
MSFVPCVLPAQCWGGTFTYERCCLQESLMSEADAREIQKLTDNMLDCGCEVPDLGPPAFQGGSFTWCKYRQAVMLNQDLRPFYMPFLELSVAMLSACPLGALSMMLLDASLKMTNSQVPPDLKKLPSFLRAQEMMHLLLQSDSLSLIGMATSGWMIFNQMSNLRGAVQRRLGGTWGDVAPCLQLPGAGTHAARIYQLVTDAVNFMPVGITSLLETLLDASASTITCSLARAGLLLIVAQSMLQQTVQPEEEAIAKVPGVPPGPGMEARSLLRIGEASLRQGLDSEAKACRLEALGILMASPWPITEVLDLLSYPGRLVLPVANAMQTLLELRQEHPLLERALTAASGHSGSNAEPRSYIFRVNPYREMVSDMVRYTKLPFCGLRPFMRMVADVAKDALQAGCATNAAYLGDAETCKFTFVEGGPHLGDCALWASASLRLAGVQTRALAFEPLPDAATLFQQSVAENGLSASVQVRNAALGQMTGQTELIHFRGHNGQATVNDYDFPSQDRREVVTIPAVEVALDDEVPANWPQIDALKLSVNGAERNTLAGARKLLSKRRVCSVLMHATKCKRGRRPPSEDPAPNSRASKFAYDLMTFLSEGNMDVYEHNDATSGQGRGRVQRVRSADEMDSIFDHPQLTEQALALAARILSLPLYPAVHLPAAWPCTAA